MNSINNIIDTYTGFRQSLGMLNAQVLHARDEAARDAASEGYPNTRHEEWKYTSLRPLLDAGFKIPTREPTWYVSIAAITSWDDPIKIVARTAL